MNKIWLYLTALVMQIRMIFYLYTVINLLYLNNELNFKYNINKFNRL